MDLPLTNYAGGARDDRPTAAGLIALSRLAIDEYVRRVLHNGAAGAASRVARLGRGLALHHDAVAARGYGARAAGLGLFSAKLASGTEASPKTASARTPRKRVTGAPARGP
jgi:hypothetical protein